MTINNPSPPGANPWTLSPRTLTGLGSAFNGNITGSNLTLANGTTAVFTGSGSGRIITISCASNASVTWSFGISIGGVNIIGQVNAAGAPAMITAIAGTLSGVSLTNSGTVSGNYSFVGIQWTA